MKRNGGCEVFLAGVVTGAAALLFVKYCVFGLKAWNGNLHPEREDMPYGRFYCPLFGAIRCREKQLF